MLWMDATQGVKPVMENWDDYLKTWNEYVSLSHVAVLAFIISLAIDSLNHHNFQFDRYWDWEEKT